LRLGLIYIILLSVIACTEKTEEIDPSDPLLASVYSQNLRLSDIKPILQTEVSQADSTMYAHSLVEKWVRDAILMHEAERNIPADLDIQKMVNDYRSSLILMTYKQKLVQEKLDTMVTQEQLEAYYEQSKNQYMLDEPILRGIFLKIDKESAEYERLDRLWKNSSFEELSAEADNLFELKLTDQSRWYTWKDIKALIPKNFWTWNEIKTKEARFKTSGNFKYFIKVEAYEDKNKIAPLSYIKDQAMKVILHKRQTEILDNLMEDLYNQYSSDKNIKINI
jgi:hypothetical protein